MQEEKTEEGGTVTAANLYLEHAKQTLTAFMNSSGSQHYCESLLKRVNVEALVAIAEELSRLNAKLEKVAPGDCVLVEGAT